MLSRLWISTPYLALAAIGLISAFHATLFSGFRLMQVDFGDARLNNYILEHTYRWVWSWLKLHPISLWNQPFFFPTNNVGAYTDILLTTAPLYWLIRLVQFPPDTAMQLWMMAVLVIDFAVMAAFLRNCLGLERWAAAGGAFLFAFGSPRITQTNHHQLFSQYYSVIALYGLFRWIKPAKLSSRQGIFLFFGAFAAQLWAGFYLGWFLFFGLLIYGLAALAFPDTRQKLTRLLRAEYKPLGLALALSLLAILPMALHYLRAARFCGVRPFWNAAMMVPPIQCWFFLGEGSWFYFWQTSFKWFRNILVPQEMKLGIGWLTLVVTLLGLAVSAKKSHWTKALVVSMGAILLVATLYPNGSMPWQIIFYTVPAANAIRAVSRIGLLLLIPLSIGFAEMIQLCLSSKKRWIPAALILVCVLEQGQSTAYYDKLQVRADVDALASAVSKSCDSFFYSPILSADQKARVPEYKLQLDAMWASQQTGVPTLNGYSGNYPPFWGSLWEIRLVEKGDVIHMAESLSSWLRGHGIEPGRNCWIQKTS